MLSQVSVTSIVTEYDVVSSSNVYSNVKVKLPSVSNLYELYSTTCAVPGDTGTVFSSSYIVRVKFESV